MSSIQCNTGEQASRFSLGFDALRKPTFACQTCGKIGEQNQGTGRKRKFCGKKCNQAAIVLAKKVANSQAGLPDPARGFPSFAKAKKECLNCKAGFEAPPQQKFCSANCREERRNHGQQRSCESCGKEFTGGSKVKYCSVACWPRTCNETSELTCESCKKTFLRKAYHSFRRFCSRDCARANNWTHARAALNELNESRELKTYQCRSCDTFFVKSKDSFPQWGYCSEACKAATFTRTCVRCWSEFVTNRKDKKFCSNECTIRFHVENAPATANPVEMKCFECERTFRTKKSPSKGSPRETRFCSKECGKRANKRTRRARQRKAYVEAVYLGVLIKRDVGVCQICNKPVNLGEVVPDDFAPTVDHVIPLAKGGEHSYANCQLAHFICNSTKGDSLDSPI